MYHGLNLPHSGSSESALSNIILGNPSPRVSDFCLLRIAYPTKHEIQTSREWSDEYNHVSNLRECGEMAALPGGWKFFAYKGDGNLR